MRAETTPTEPAAAAAAAVGMADTAPFLQILHILHLIGSAIARRIVADASTWSRDTKAAYERVSRTLRRIIMLAMEIEGRGSRQPAEPPAPSKGDRSEHEDLKDRPDWYDPPEAERRGRLGPLVNPDVPYDLTNKTMDELIEEICRDLGLPKLDGTYHWSSLTVAEIAKLVAAAAKALVPAAKAAAPFDVGSGGGVAQGSPPDLDLRVYDG